MAMTANNDEFFKSNEEKILEDMSIKRRLIINDKLAGGTPSNTRELELVLGALTHEEDIIIKKARLRVSSKSNDSADNLSANIAAVLLRDMANNKVPPPLVVNANTELPTPPKDFGADVEIVPGELDDNDDSILSPKDLKK